MSLKKRASKSIALALVGITVVTPLLGTVHADSYNSLGGNVDAVDSIKEYEIESRLGGGPSPSATWTYKSTNSHTFTASELDKLNLEYQGVINSFGYNIGQKAYNASLIALGYMGKKNTGANVANTLSWFAKTYHSEIQRSANVLANAASKNKSVNLRVKEYVRPASGETMILFY